MIRRIAVLLVMLVAAGNTAAEANNPSDRSASESVTVNQNQPSTKAEERKLSRRERRERLRVLPDRYHEFLQQVEPIITDKELNAFLLLETDSQRDYFIEQFWSIRDTDPATARNEYRELYRELLLEAKERFRYLSSDRSRVYLVQGRPADIIEINCQRYVVPIQVWHYPYIQGLGQDVLLIFYQQRLGGNDYRLWQPTWGMEAQALRELISIEGERMGGSSVFTNTGLGDIRDYCRDGEVLLAAIGWSTMNSFDIHKVFEPAEIDSEHVARTLRNTVIANPNAPVIPAEASFEYPGRRGTRSAVRIFVEVPTESLGIREIDGSRFYNLDVTGEVLKDGQFFENYRYRYDFPAEIVGEMIPVVIERYLRPAEYLSRLKIADTNSGAEAILENEITVPTVEAGPVSSAARLEASDKVESLRQEYFMGESRLRIVPLPSDIITGLRTIETIVTGEEIARVEFYVDGRKIMTKTAPPYSLELDFGLVPAARRLRVVGLDARENLVAGDEIVFNTGADPFRAHIAYPRIAPQLSGQVRVEIEVEVPESKTLDRVELYLNEDRVGTMFDPPFTQMIFIPHTLEVGYLRAVAITSGDEPLETEDVVLLNTPHFTQEIDVHLVELPTTVLRNGSPVQNLPQSSFRVLDGGREVEIAKFEYLRDIPLNLGIAIDSSGSMEERMMDTQRAAAQFFRQILRRGDRAFIISFADVPLVVRKWTDDREDLVRGLASLRAEGATALYDSVVYSLYNFQGIQGQKALVLLSDGKDTTSRFSFEQALEYSRRSAVPLYSIGIGIGTLDRETRSRLARLSSETGGRSYFIDGIEQLDRIYNEIETELRAQYLLGFYPHQEVSRGSGWRDIEVRVPEGDARTIRGYYP
jgi:Ca-activated chloride channel homolog